MPSIDVAQARLTDMPQTTRMETEKTQALEANQPLEAKTDDERRSASQGPAAALPYDGLILIPVRNLVLFPGLIVPLNVARGKSIAAAQEAARMDRLRRQALLSPHGEKPPRSGGL